MGLQDALLHWPFLASAGGYPFKKTAEGYDVNDIGVANAGALEGLKAIVELINTGILPKGSTQNLMGEKMASDQLALMVSGPWDWACARALAGIGVLYRLSGPRHAGDPPAAPGSLALPERWLRAANLHRTSL